MIKPPEPNENLLQAIRDNTARHITFKEWCIEQHYKTIAESQEEINKLEHELVALNIAHRASVPVTKDNVVVSDNTAASTYNNAPMNKD